MVQLQERPPVPATKTYGTIRCNGTRITGRFKGQLCDELLARVDVDRWEASLADTAQHVCPRCKTRYRLADFLK